MRRNIISMDRSDMDQRETQPLPLQYFDEIEMQLTGLWLVKHLLPSTGMAVLYGHPGSGKTFLALDWSLHVALGWEWHGRKVKQGLVVYICAEGVSGLRNRVEAFRRHHDVKSVPFALIPTSVDLQAPDADVNRVIEAIRTAEEHYGENAVLIVVDTISKTFGAGKENTDDMVSYVANCQRLSNQFECLTMPVHHRPKDAESEEPRGHSSLKGGAETIIIVEAGETKKARITKQKDGEDGIEMLFKLKVVELGQDEDGDPVTSCIVEATGVDLAPRGDNVGAKIAKLPDGARLALSMLNETLEQSGFYPPNDIPDGEINRMIVGKVTRLVDWRQKYRNALGTDGDTQGDTEYQRFKKSFQRVRERLQNDGIVRVFGDYVWRTWQDKAPAEPTRGHQGTHKGTSKNQAGGHRGHSGAPLQGPPEMSPSVSPSVAPGENVPNKPTQSLAADNPILNRGAPPSNVTPLWIDEAPPIGEDDPFLNFGEGDEDGF